MINDELRAIQSVLNETSRASHEGAVPATLIVAGQVITGFIVSQLAYQRTREASAADSLTKRVAAALNKVDSASPEASKRLQHVYLRGARFVLPDIRLGSSILKLSIDAIDGFMFGIEGDDEGLVLGASPVLPGSAESGARQRSITPTAASPAAGLNPGSQPASAPAEPASAPVEPAAGAAQPAAESGITEPSCPGPEFAEILRRVAGAVDADEGFRLIVAGHPVNVPAGAELSIAHETHSGGEELQFKISWMKYQALEG